MTTITVYATSDLHAHWDRPAGGIRRALGLLSSRDRERSLWIDNGDTLSGSPLGAFLAAREADHPVLPALEQAGLDVWVPGNHDFDHGADVLARRAGALTSAVGACANVTRAGSRMFAPSVVVERAGVRIGVIGAITGHLQRLTRYASVRDVTVSDVVEAVAAEASRLRPRVDLLIVSYHGGFEADPATGSPTQYDTGEDQAYRLLSLVPGIDGLIAGHQHRETAGVASGAFGEVAFAQPGYAGSHVGVLTFEVAGGAAGERAVVARSGALEATAGARPAADAKLDEADRACATWWEGDAEATPDELHDLVSSLTGASATVLRLPRGRSWRELADVFPPPYGVELYRMPASELHASLAGQDVSVRGAEHRTGDVVVAASQTLRGTVLPAGRVEVARPYDVIDELVSRRFLRSAGAQGMMTP